MFEYRSCVKVRSNFSNRWREEELCEREACAKSLIRLQHDSCCKQGMASQFEEIIVDTDVIELECVRPDASDDLLGRGSGGNIDLACGSL